MEQLPADARAAPSASEPNDTVMDIHASPKRQRESSQGNMVSQSATSTASVLPESQSVTTVLLHRAPARACQSLAHHTTPMGRCRKSVDTWAPLSEESQSRSTTTQAGHFKSCNFLFLFLRPYALRRAGRPYVVRRVRRPYVGPYGPS
eukprot:scaffold4328_cov135-Isochrysis_galbana.AAC.5